MYKVVLLRHGESDWNKQNRFTGWTDVDLSEKGIAEASTAGKLMKEAGFAFDVAFTSVLKRAIRQRLIHTHAHSHRLTIRWYVQQKVISHYFSRLPQ